MEDGLVLGSALVENTEFAVLILIVVEDGLVLETKILSASIRTKS